MKNFRICRNVTWTPGTLRFHESILSFGAWFCNLNKINSGEFVRFLKRIEAPAIDAITVAGGIAQSLSEVLGERLDIVKSMKLGGDPAGGFGCVPSYDFLRWCDECDKELYHSVWHQVPWITHCIFHGCELKVEGDRWLDGLGGHSRIKPYSLALLQTKWFGAAAKSADALKRLGVRGMQHVAPDAFAEVVDSDLLAAQRAVGSGQVSIFALHPPFGAVCCREVCGKTAPVWIDRTTAAGDPRRTRRWFRTNDSVSHEVLRLNYSQIERILDVRRMHCHFAKLMPEWRRREEVTLKALANSGHSECVKTILRTFVASPNPYSPLDVSQNIILNWWDTNVWKAECRSATICPATAGLRILSQRCSVLETVERVIRNRWPGNNASAEFLDELGRNDRLADQFRNVTLPPLLFDRSRFGARMRDQRSRFNPILPAHIHAMNWSMLAPHDVLAALADDILLRDAEVRHDILVTHLDDWATNHMKASSGLFRREELEHTSAFSKEVDARHACFAIRWDQVGLHWQTRWTPKKLDLAAGADTFVPADNTVFLAMQAFLAGRFNYVSLTDFVQPG